MTRPALWPRARRPGRRTNLALLVLVALALATGTLAYAVGAAPATTAVTLAHGAVGLAIVLLVPWKSVLVRRGLARPLHSGRAAGVALAWVLALVVLSGLAQATIGLTTTALTPLQVHVTAALLAVPLLVGHLVTHWQRPRASDLSRRAFLSTGALAVGAVASALAVEGVARALRLPGGSARGTGSTQLGSSAPDVMPVTQWFTDQLPARTDRDVPLRVVVGGRAVDVDAADLAATAVDELDAVLDCTGGWYAAQRWRGVRLDRLLPTPLPSSARSLDVVSATGYRRRFPLEDAPRLLLATAVGGAPLSPGHGSPRRLVAPGRRGFWWVKWVVAVEVNDEPPALQPPFPLQ